MTARVLCVLLLVGAVGWALATATPATARGHPESFRAIRLAARAFHVSERDMVSVARCETGATFDPRSFNQSSGAAGLFQILYPSTWRTTPFADLSPFDPIANALAAAWIVHRDGSWREWACAWVLR